MRARTVNRVLFRLNMALVILSGAGAGFGWIPEPVPVLVALVPFPWWCVVVLFTTHLDSILD